MTSPAWLILKEPSRNREQKSMILEGVKPSWWVKFWCGDCSKHIKSLYNNIWFIPLNVYQLLQMQCVFRPKKIIYGLNADWSSKNGIGPTILGGVVTDQNGITLHYIKLTRVRFKTLHSQNCNLPVVFSERPVWVISIFFPCENRGFPNF